MIGAFPRIIALLCRISSPIQRVYPIFIGITQILFKYYKDFFTMYPAFSLQRHAQVGVKPKYCPRFPVAKSEKMYYDVG